MFLCRQYTICTDRVIGIIYATCISIFLHKLPKNPCKLSRFQLILFLSSFSVMYFCDWYLLIFDFQSSQILVALSLSTVASMRETPSSCKKRHSECLRGGISEDVCDKRKYRCIIKFCLRFSRDRTQSARTRKLLMSSCCLR